MSAAEIALGESHVVFFEPDGLLLQMQLRPTPDADRSVNALVLQMSYLGVGQIAVDIDLVTSNGMVANGGMPAGHLDKPLVSSGGAVLRGLVDGRLPAVWMKEVVVSGETMLHWIVRGESGPDHPLRGELRSTITGRPRRVTVETYAGATRD